MKRPTLKRPRKDTVAHWPFTWWFRVFIPLLVGLGIRQVLIEVGHHPVVGTGADVGFTVLYYVGGLLVINIPSISFICSLLRDMIKIDSLAKPPGRSEIITFAKSAEHRLLEQTAGVLGPTGQVMTKDAVDEFTKMCFRQGAGTYSGVESHPPSEFFTRYPGYLDAHDLNLAKNPQFQSVRILLATRVALREDYQKDGKAFKDFYDWHEDRSSVELLHVPPRLAKKVANDLSLPTTDIGIWEDQYALLFAPEVNGTSVGLTMIGKGCPAFASCEKYLHTLSNSGAKVTYPPQLVGDTIAQNWEAYVNPIKRHIELAPVLLNHLSQYKSERSPILDAAAGIGCESVLLKDDGFTVVANEIERSFSEAAGVYAHNRGVALGALQPYDWLELSQRYPTKFGAVLVLGNSICLVPDKVKRRSAVTQFFDVLQDGGTLIIDERNFPYMLRNKEKILKNPALNFPFGACMYRGATVKGCPIEISEQKIIWACYKDGDAVKDWETLTRRTIGEFELYPFKAGELAAILTDSGFNIKAIYYDLALNPTDDAEFITYVAQKP